MSTPAPGSAPYGEYLVTMGLCQAFHTPGEGPPFDFRRRFAGRRKFSIAGYSVVSANITPDRDTGIGIWTLDHFLERFRRHRAMTPEMLPAAAPELFTIMPWRNLATLTDVDLTAMDGYLMSRPAVTQKVETHPVQVASSK